MSSSYKRYLRKQIAQKVNSQENALYYQNGSEQHSPRSDGKRQEQRRLPK